MGYKLVAAGAKNSTSGVPEISFYGKTSQFRLNGAAMAMLGNPDKVEIYYDPDTSQMAITYSEAEYAVILRKDSENSETRFFGLKALAVKAGLAEDARFVVPITIDDDTGTYMASLSAETIANAPKPRQGRKPNKGVNVTLVDDNTLRGHNATQEYEADTGVLVTTS